MALADIKTAKHQVIQNSIDSLQKVEDEKSKATQIVKEAKPELGFNFNPSKHLFMFSNHTNIQFQKHCLPRTIQLNQPH